MTFINWIGVTVVPIKENINKNKSYNINKMDSNNWKSISDNIQQRLQNGESLNNVVDGYDRLGDDMFLVGYDNKYNFISKDCNVLSPDQWFDWCGYFRDGFAIVQINNKFNFIDKNGNFISPNLWFDNCHEEFNRRGFATVTIGGEQYKINTEGMLCSLSEEPIKYLKEEIRRKNKIKLTESDIRRIVKKTLNRILLTM